MFDINCVPPKFRQELDTVEKWLKFQGIIKYTIENDGVVINQGIKLIGVVSNLPFKIKKVDGDMVMSYNPITSFKNMPEVVTGSLKANGLGITSLKGIPDVGCNIILDGCKMLHDITDLQKEIKGDLSIYGCSIRNIDIPNTINISGSVNFGNNAIVSVSSRSKVEIGDTMSLSNNLIVNTDQFYERLTARFLDFSGNPCKADDEFDTDCNW